MKHFVLFLLSFVFIQFASGQDIAGDWNGALNVMGMQLRLVFHIDRTETGWKATMDSPDQNAFGIPVSKIAFDGSKLNIGINAIALDYTGELKDEKITGTFTQGGQQFPLDLSREKIEKQTFNRPQEPKRPFPYSEEEVFFENAEGNAKLAGTLTLPKEGGIFPAVVLITGSGPQNRDEELMNHKPFLVLADYLTRNGIAVLRYDDRGTASSTGNFGAATSDDFSKDAEAGVNYLQTRKEINREKIGLIGHSEGGMIASMIAARSKAIAFVVLLAGCGIAGDQILLLQQDLIAKASGIEETDRQLGQMIGAGLFERVKKSNDTEQLKTDLTTYLKQVIDQIPDEKSKEKYDTNFVHSSVSRLTVPWMQYFLKYDPSTALEKVKCPVLAVNGEKDLQVPPKENLQAIQEALEKGGNANVTIREFPKLNHLFQECETGLPAEYVKIEQTFSPVALDFITQWILEQTR